MRKFGFGVLLCAAIVSPTVFSFQAPGGDARQLAGQPLIVALNKYDNSISFVDPRRGFRVVSTIATCVEPHEVSLSPDGRRGYVGCAGGNEVAVVETRYFKTVAVTHVGTHPDGIIYRAGAQPGQSR